MGKVIFNSDDFGYSYGVNDGIIQAYQRGILTSTTLMANMPGFEHAVELAKRYPNLGVGVHLTATCGCPLMAHVDTLVDGDSFHTLSFYHQDYEIDLNQLYQEWDSQIQKVYRAGLVPTHLDSHHHVHTFGKNQEVVVELAKKYHLPVRGNFEQKNQVKHVQYFEPYFDDVGQVEEKKRQIKEPIHRYLDNLLVKLRTYQTSEVMCHAAYLDKALLEGSSFVYPRIEQVEFLIHSTFAQKIKDDNEIELVTYQQI